MKLRISEKHSMNQMFNTALLMVYLMAYFLLGLLPYIKYSVPYVFAGIFTLIPAFIVCVERTPYGRTIIYMGLAGLMYGLLSYLLGNSNFADIANEPIRTIRYFVPCILLSWTFALPRKNQVLIWWWITAILLFVVINTLLALEIDPMIARILASGSRDSELMAYRLRNIGGFEFCYAVCLLCSLAVYLSIRTKGAVRAAAIAAVLLITYFTIQAQYMTMLMLCIAAFVFVMMYCTKKNASKIIAVLLSAFFLLVLPGMLRWIATFDVGDQLYSKLMAVAGVLDGTRELDEETARAGLYLDAILDFLRSPIWGTPHSEPAANSHSTFLGVAASTGIIGLSIYIYGITQCYKQTKTTLMSQLCRTGVFSMSYLVFVILAFVNPVNYAYELSMMLFFYIPLTMILVSNKHPLIAMRRQQTVNLDAVADKRDGEIDCD